MATAGKWLRQLTLQSKTCKLARRQIQKYKKSKTEILKYTVRVEATDGIDCVLGKKTMGAYHVYEGLICNQTSVCLIVCLEHNNGGVGHVYGGLIRSRLSGGEH